jgi:hypothetical protein
MTPRVRYFQSCLVPSVATGVVLFLVLDCYAATHDAIEQLAEYSRLASSNKNVCFDLENIESGDRSKIMVFGDRDALYLNVSLGKKLENGDDTFVRVEQGDEQFSVKKASDKDVWRLSSLEKGDARRLFERTGPLNYATSPWSLLSVPFHELLDRNDGKIDFSTDSKDVSPNDLTILVNFTNPNENYTLSGVDDLPFAGSDRFEIVLARDGSGRISKVIHEWKYKGNQFKDQLFIEHISQDHYIVKHINTLGIEQNIKVARCELQPGDEIVLELSSYGIERPPFETRPSYFWFYLVLVGVVLIFVGVVFARLRRT